MAFRYYRKENDEFRKYTGKEYLLTHTEIHDLIEKCTSHFVLPMLSITFKSCNGKILGVYFEKLHMVTFYGNKSTVLTVLHELAHHMDSIRNGAYRKGYDKFYGTAIYRKSHTKKLRACLVDLIDYYEYLQNKNKYDNAVTLSL